MSRLRAWLAALVALRWGRALIWLVILVAIPSALYGLAHSLVEQGVLTAFRYTGSMRSSGDLLAMVTRAMLDWSQGWVIPVMLVYSLASAGLVISCLKPDFAPPPKKVKPRAKSIRTARLVLRRAMWADREVIHAIFSDDETLQYWDRLPYATIEESGAWLDSICALPPETSDVFLIEREGRVIGLIGSMSFPWLTFALTKSEWRKGYASEALAAFTGYMFGRGLPAIHVATHPDNAASLALVHKAGFEEYGRSTGLFTVRGEPGAAVHLRLSSPDAPEEEPEL